LKENYPNVKIYFFLTFKNITNSNQEHLRSAEESINNLIYKGDQKDLEKFKQENKIIIFDDDELQVDLERQKRKLKNIIFQNFLISKQQDNITNDTNSSPYIINEEDQILFDLLNKKLNNQNENKFKCFVL